jgi:Protein of unknown function (DUF3592)
MPFAGATRRASIGQTGCGVIVLASSPVHGLAIAFGAAFTGAGLLFILIAVGMMLVSGRFRRRGVRAQGRIVDFTATDPTFYRIPGTPFGHPRGPRMGPPIDPGALGQGGVQPASPGLADPLRGIIYRPTVVFTTPDGREVRATSTTGTNPRSGKVGDAVTVYYDPNDPQRVQVSSTRRVRTCVETGFIVLGTPFVVVGVAILLAAH